ncbi:Ribosomal protein S18 acetylase RimI [Cohaesibacter sp. ES.047]|uniref:GNAT family N-acetyltransferase n=1 Tax=Cohaesibacter sp. ES.047 TaxID=1798205 RepID=UPI000BB7F6C9|nr:GNAT family N-acetyltransferase [Cohaesibacter sp. ES.047]SNY92080.1 Ribosomal protein S18 acetylase RimI [Cohaesibacter sp. ES.047]
MTLNQPVFSLRSATPEDAGAIAHLKVVCWQHAYKGLLPKESLDRLDAEAEIHHWRDWLADDGEDLIARLIAVDGEPVGYGLAGPMRTGDREGEELETDAELYALYIHPDYQRSGHGQRLFVDLAAALIAQNYQGLGLWMAARNHVAELFFAKMCGAQARKRVVISHGRIAFREQGWTWDDLRKSHTRLTTYMV